METSTYYVGDRPGGAWNFQVLNERSGTPLSLSGYVRTRMIMLDPDNNEIVFPEENVYITDASNGTVTFLWPDVSVFTKPGNYVMQLEFSGTTVTRRTSVKDILIRKIGGVSR